MIELLWLESDISEPSFFEFESGAVLAEDPGKGEIILVCSVFLEQISSFIIESDFLKVSSLHLISKVFINLIMMYFFMTIFIVFKIQSTNKKIFF